MARTPASNSESRQVIYFKISSSILHTKTAGYALKLVIKHSNIHISENTVLKEEVSRLARILKYR